MKSRLTKKGNLILEIEYSEIVKTAVAMRNAFDAVCIEDVSSRDHWILSEIVEHICLNRIKKRNGKK